MKTSRSFIVAFVVVLFASLAVAQHGGKAEPERIRFGRCNSSMTLSATLSNGQEMEYIFAAGKGQRVRIKMLTPGLFDFRVFLPDSDFDTEFDSSPAATIELPENGDYLLYVRKKISARRSKAQFRLSLSIE